MSKRYWLLLIVWAGLSLFSSKAFALAESTDSGGSNAQAVHSLGYKGQGINIGLMGNKNLYSEHEAFRDKDSNGLPTGPTHAFNYDVTGAGIVEFDHDTWMAGIAVSRGGIAHPNDIGAAPAADIHCVRIIPDSGPIYLTYITNGLNKLIVDNNCRVITTAFASGETPDGSSDLTLIYDYYAFTYDVVFANAAGNGGTILWPPGDAFNGITTGGLIETSTDIYNKVGNVSGSGKTADNRRKPDIVAPSDNQMVPHTYTDTTSIWKIPNYHQGETSLSVPQAAGVAALLLSLADDTNNVNDHHNEVIRAVMVNSSLPNINDKNGLSTNPTTTVWQKDRGYGRLDALRAHLLLSSSQVSPGVIINQPNGWAYEIMTEESQTDHYYITAQKNQRLVLTVTWNRKIDKNGPNYSEESPRLNLDLKVIGPFSQELFVEDSNDDNLEKVDILLPDDGIYGVTLEKKTNHIDRSYAMAFELIDKIPADFNIDYIVDANDLAQLTDDWLLPVSTAPTDLYEDGFIDLRDFSAFAADWQRSNPTYY